MLHPKRHDAVPADPPPGRFTPGQALLCGVLAALIDLAYAIPHAGALARGTLINPDSYMRLVRLDDILTAREPLDVIMRDGSGSGTVMHWSHLLDSLLLVLALPMAPTLGEHEALRLAGVMMGPLSAALLGAALAWATAPLSDPAWRWTAAVAAMLAAPIAAYAQPGVVHHHILVALSGVMCAGWAARAGLIGGRAGWWIGAWAAFGLWLSPEALPIALLAFGGIGIGWVVHPGDARPTGASGRGVALATGMTVLAALSGLALAVDPPSAGRFSVQVDRLSIAFVTLALLGGAAGWGLCLVDRLGPPPFRRAMIGAGIIACAAGLWLALFPLVITTPEEFLNQGYAHAFDGIEEMKPITSAADAIRYLLTGALAACLAIGLAIRRRSIELAYVAACLLLLIAASVAHRRFSTYPACACAAAVPVALTLISRRLADRRAIAAVAARVALLLLVLLGPLLPLAFAARTAVTAACSIQQIAPMLRRFAGDIVLADVNDTPELLYRTRLRTIGSLVPQRAGFFAPARCVEQRALRSRAASFHGHRRNACTVLPGHRPRRSGRQSGFSVGAAGPRPTAALAA